jgi:hypothetical protein
LGDTKASGVFDIGVLTNVTNFPVLLFLVKRITTLAQFALKVVYKTRGKHYIDLMGGHERFSDGDSRACLSGSETMINEETSVRCFSNKIVANKLLVRKKFSAWAGSDKA